MIEISAYPATDATHDTQISNLLREVYIDAGFTAPTTSPRGFSIEELHRRGKIILAVDAARQVVGMVIVGTSQNPFKQVATEHEAEMQLLGVQPGMRAQGLGAALCKAFEEEARRQRFRSAVLSTQPMMTAAHRLYERLAYARNPARDWERMGRKFLVYEKFLGD